MTIARVQSQSVAGSSPFRTCNVLFSSVTAGNLLIAYAYLYSSNTPTVTDTQGNTWSTATTICTNGAIVSAIQILYAVVGITGVNQVTLTSDIDGSGLGLVVEEYSGVGAFDAGAVVSDQTSSTPSVSLTTTAANDLVVCAAIEQASATVSAGSGFTLGVQTTAKWWEVTEYNLNAGAAGSVTASLGLSTSARATMMIAAFLKASSGSPVAAWAANSNSAIGSGARVA